MARKGTSGLDARRAALGLLQDVLWSFRPLDAVMDRRLQGLAQRDRALARTVASHVLRWCVDLDAIIDEAVPKRLPDDARARMVLRMALAQLLLLDTPPHAVVTTALPLVDGGPRRLVHGVLSRIARARPKLPDRPAFPEPWAARWTRHYGPNTVLQLREALGHPPPIDLRLKDPTRTADYVERLGATSSGPGHLRLAESVDVRTLAGFAEGDWWVQDRAAALVAEAAEVKPGEAVADLCAAPGGKTLLMAAAGAQVTAVDIADWRMERLRDNLARTGLAAEAVTSDILKWAPGRTFDAVLLDAPCSATGTFRRHPDVLYLKAGRDLSPLLATQEELFDRAAQLVRPGGRLVYAVCSLEPEEGEAQVENFVGRNPAFGLDPIAHEAALPNGAVRTLPPAGDGFFIARLVRR